MQEYVILFVLEAEGVRVPMLKFGILQVLLRALFILQAKVVSAIILQFRLLRFEALKVDVLQILLCRIRIF